ncbi:hypothetical protein H2248_000572 [Termitomyces sp. 'cryptogamus']|nr:hypothetical protein H2248_000572 [Termitomyces sp. 'cryptogamus']
MVSASHWVSSFTLAGVVSLVSFSLGFYVGARGSLLKGADFTAATSKNEDTNDEDEDEVERIVDGDLSAVKAGTFEPCKLVLVVRTNLKLTSGKIAAQCGHATLACYKALIKVNPQRTALARQTLGKNWIALKGTSEEQLLELEAIAKSLNLCARSIQDQGLTQVEEGTRTVLGIGPAPVNMIDEVTGKLRLL